MHAAATETGDLSRGILNFVTYVNATLPAITRLRLARLIVDDGWTHAAAAMMFMVAPKTAGNRTQRYRLDGPAEPRIQADNLLYVNLKSKAPAKQRI